MRGKPQLLLLLNIARIELMAGNDTPSVLAEVFDHKGILVTSVMVTLSAADKWLPPCRLQGKAPSFHELANSK